MRANNSNTLTQIVVDGMNPKKGMQRLIRWLESPVETNQPGYAKEKGEKEDGYYKKNYTSKL